MSQDHSVSIKQLCEAFVFMRQQGASPDYALNELRRLRPVISPQEREQIVAFIRHWENDIGGNFPPQHGIQITPWTPESRPDKRFEINPPVNSTRKLSSETLKEHANDAPVKDLVFSVKSYEHAPIVVDVSQVREFIIGRASDESILIPEVDLTGYSGGELGVSRVHAAVRYEDNVVTIGDMGSVNNTYLNGEQIYPQEVRLLPDEAEIRLGRLLMQVHIRR